MLATARKSVKLYKTSDRCCVLPQVEAGRTKHIGISNHSVQKVKELLAHAKIKPAVNQFEVHPYWCVSLGPKEMKEC